MALATRLGPLQAHLQGVSALRPDPAIRSLLAFDGVEPRAFSGAVDAYAPPAFLDALETTGQRVPISGAIGTDGDECYVDGTVIIESVGLALIRYFTVAGPTYLCQDAPDDRAALHAIADDFRASGVLPDYLLSPVVLTEFGRWTGADLEPGWRTTLRVEDPGAFDDDVAAGVPFLMAAALAARRLVATPDRIRFPAAGLWLNDVDDLGDVRPVPAFPLVLALLDGRPVAVDMRTLTPYGVGADAGWLLELKLWGDEEACERAARRRGLPARELEAAATTVASRVGL